MPRLPEQNKKIKDQRRAKLLSCALQVFEEVGYSQATVDAITKLNGCSHGLFYHYYDDIGAIYRDVYECYVKASPLYEFSNRIKDARGVEGLQVLFELLEAVQKSTPRNAALASLVWESLAEERIDEARSPIKKDFPIRSAFSRFAKEAAEEGRLVDRPFEEVKALASLITNAIMAKIKAPKKERGALISADTLMAAFVKS